MSSMTQLPPDAEIDPDSRRILEQKLIAVPIKGALWLYMFGAHGQQAYHDTELKVRGEPKQDRADAAEPDTKYFINKVHSYYTDEGLLIVRRRDLANTRLAEGGDFMVTYTDLRNGEFRRLPVADYKHTYSDLPTRRPLDIYTFGEDDTNFGEAVVSARAPRAPYGTFRLDGANDQQLLGEAFELPERAEGARRYFTETELGHVANMHQVATMAS